MKNAILDKWLPGITAAMIVLLTMVAARSSSAAASADPWSGFLWIWKLMGR